MLSSASASMSSASVVTECMGTSSMSSKLTSHTLPSISPMIWEQLLRWSSTPSTVRSCAPSLTVRVPTSYMSMSPRFSTMPPESSSMLPNVLFTEP